VVAMSLQARTLNTRTTVRRFIRGRDFFVQPVTRDLVPTPSSSLPPSSPPFLFLPNTT
jgi:hypothetical protein